MILRDGKIIGNYDKNFPNIPLFMKDKDKPCLLAYVGDISLLNQSHKNVAVVGVLTPTRMIVERERKIIAMLADNGMTIVSGLAVGCDTIAHEAALEFGTKTIAILPTTLDNIYPNCNQQLAERIVAQGGLVVTEYITEPANKWERIKRFIERDRLQACFASKAMLIASYRKGEGDSGARHCMNKAMEYGVQRYIMFDCEIDKSEAIFGLNEDLFRQGVPAITRSCLCVKN